MRTKKQKLNKEEMPKGIRIETKNGFHFVSLEEIIVRTYISRGLFLLGIIGCIFSYFKNNYTTIFYIAIGCFLASAVIYPSLYPTAKQIEDNWNNRNDTLEFYNLKSNV